MIKQSINLYLHSTNSQQKSSHDTYRYMLKKGKGKLGKANVFDVLWLICLLQQHLMAEYTCSVAERVVRVDSSTNSMENGNTGSRAEEKSITNGGT